MSISPKAYIKIISLPLPSLLTSKCDKGSLTEFLQLPAPRGPTGSNVCRAWTQRVQPVCVPAAARLSTPQNQTVRCSSLLARMCEVFYPPIASLNLVFGPMLKRGDPSRTFSAEARHQIVLSQLLFPTTLLRSYGGLDAQKGVTPDPSSPQWFRIHSAAIVCPFRGLR
jgi:hypothetical protein